MSYPHIFYFSSQILSGFLLRCRPGSVPEGASVQWEVELLDFESAKVRHIRSFNLSSGRKETRRPPPKGEICQSTYTSLTLLSVLTSVEF